jgi:hypothetical protein
MIEKAMYTREDIIEAGLLRFHEAGLVTPSYEKMFYDFYDENGRETFRLYASVNAEAMKKWIQFKKNL